MRSLSPAAFWAIAQARPAPTLLILSPALGLVRDRQGLVNAISDLLPLAPGGGPAADHATVGLMIAVSALNRAERRGAHFRADFRRRAEPRAEPISICRRH